MTSNGRRAPGPVPEEEMLLADRSKANIINAAPNGKIEKQLVPEPVRLTPAWEETNLTNEELNFQGLTMDQVHLEANPPRDRWNMVYLIFLLHGIGTLLPWNMFINAKIYFVDYKLSNLETVSSNYTLTDGPPEVSEYARNFMSYLGIAAQAPNLMFNWLNIFIKIGGKLTTRIVWSILIEMFCFIVTVVLAMTDSSTWPGLFFAATMAIVVVLNMAGGIYQNTVYGMAAKLPSSYTAAIILGSNISGTFSSVISIGSLMAAPNPRTAAIYYFITALFALSLCFDTYFALPLIRFYKYNELMAQKDIQRRAKESAGRTTAVPYWKIFKECFPQCFNIFFTFFVTLSVFPSVSSDVKKSDPNFIITDKYYIDVMCFLTFNAAAMIGSSLPAIGSWPNPRRLWIPVILRVAFIPLFLFCNYHPRGSPRTWPVFIDNDIAYWAIGVALGVSAGYFSSIAMMYCSRSVSLPEHAPYASMFGAACIITGICAGLGAAIFFPWAVSNLTLPFI